eukprot:Sspe_Gene.20197::Locus_7413_Transcript_1_1_Confidence_1.000_Length_2079::g.20197::m.20197/K05681/ABCG2, CD338; ATP-binding cassette, subfamily G (WHITE), member 2
MAESGEDEPPILSRNGTEETEEVSEVRSDASSSTESRGHGVEIAFEELTLTRKKRTILSDVDGIVPAGRVTGFLGTESSGTVDLLRCLAGLQKYTGGRIYANGAPIEASSYRKCVGYVPTRFTERLGLTIEQTLRFALRMRRPIPRRTALSTDHNPPSPEDEHVKCPTCSFSTESVSCPGCGLQLEGWRLAARLVGLRTNGRKLLSAVSEELRKRVAIATELLYLPRVMFLEIPTDNLDLSASLRLMRVLRSLAHNRGMTISLTLSQPRRPIFELLDNAFLLDQGGVAFAGKAKDVLPYFQEQGHDIDSYDCPSDYFLDLSAAESLAASGRSQPHPEQSTDLVTQFRQSRYSKMLSEAILDHYERGFDYVTPGIPDHRAPSNFRRLFELIRYRVIAVRNDWRTSLSRLLVVCLLGLVAGLVYSKANQDNQVGMQNRVGILFFILSAMMLGNLAEASEYVRRRPTIVYEVESGYYPMWVYFAAYCLFDVVLVRGLLTMLFGIIAYFLIGFDFSQSNFDQDHAHTLGNLCVCMAMTQLPFSMLALLVGALSRDAISAQYIMITIFVIFVALGGLFINSDTIPPPFNVLQYCSVLRLSYESVLIGELRGHNFSCSPTTPNITGYNNFCYTGDGYLSLQGFDNHEHQWLNIKILTGYSAFFCCGVSTCP